MQLETERKLMCSDPQSQPNKDTGEIMVFACRRCNECIATRRHNWVARAMAEKATNAHCVVVTLTYSDKTQAGRDGARMFCYADVRAFLKRLRAAARYEAKKQKWGFVPYVRFICAGEQGSRNGRCHWHIVLYSNVDLSQVGKFQRSSGEFVTDRRDIVCVGSRVRRRLMWSLWSHGFMLMQEAGEAGMHYVLSYCLKDQFIYEKSKGTMREAKAENFATGLFRMSKYPPIGEVWLMQKMDSLLEKGAVLPALKLRVAGFHGYWQPSGSFREKLLRCLVAVNDRIIQTTGANAPQWSSLLASCQDNESDMGILNGKEKEDEVDHIGARVAVAEASGIADAWQAAGAVYADDERFYRLSAVQCETLGLRPYQDAAGRIRFWCQRGPERGGNNVSLWPLSDLAILNAGSPFADRVAATWRDGSRQGSQGGRDARPSYMQAAP